ncbi:MAG: rod shape-determining protein MreD [Deltaproteobacteria bacterium]|nr:rod shape-determining protein MreD [Deltaproteobacteria bacterium]
MMYFILLPLILLIMVSFQATVLDNLFFGKSGVDLSIIIVIYIGLRIKPLQGGILSLLIGYFIDCTTGVLSGLHAFTYVVLFFTAKLYFLRIRADKLAFMAFFCFMSILLEGFAVLLFYGMLYENGILHNLLAFTLPRAVVGGILSPVIFEIFHFVEGALGYENTGPFERA